MRRGLFLFVVFLFAAHSMNAQTTMFTKGVAKVNGVAVSNPPGSLTNGDTVDWVIRYQYNPGSATPAQVVIRDPLPPTLQYVPGSLQVPPTWTKQWFTGSWGSVEANATGVGAVVSPAPIGVGQTVLIPAPPSSGINTSGLGGDGYRPISYNGKIYVLNHHIAGRYLDCFDPSTGARCNGYPAHVPLTAGTYIGNNNNDNATPYKTYEFLDRNSGRLYFAVQKAAPPFDIGVLCADLNAQQSCGFTKLFTHTVFSSTSFQGVGGVNGKVYVQLPNGQLGCVDTATSMPCANQPMLVTNAALPVTGSSEIVGTRIYTLWQRNVPDPFVITCLDTMNDQPCAGVWPVVPDPAGRAGILFPLLDAAGAVKGICARTTNPLTSTAFSCYGITTGGSVSHPASYQSWANSFGGGSLQGNFGLGQPGYYHARVFNGHTQGAPGAHPSIGCYDFATSNPCAEPAWPLTGVNVTAVHYATVADPERPGCMWSYGDDGRLGSFQAADGLPCSGRTAIDTMIRPADSYCASNGDISRWGSLSLSGLSGVSATLTLYDGNNPSNLARDASGNPYAQNLPITSFPFNLGGVGYGTGAGNYTSLRIVLQFSGITSNTPWTQNPPPRVQVSWAGAPPEICFKTKVATCENARVTNQATAVTTPAGGSPINDTAPNPAFTAAHVFGPECGPAGGAGKLTVTKTVQGAPAGFTGTFKFNVTCATQTGLVQQQVSINWPGTSVSLNIPAGSTCTVSEDPSLPALPAGYLWSGVPVVTPAGGVIQVGHGASQVSFVNVARPCDDNGKIRIHKNVQGVPQGFTGTFNFHVACWSGSTLITKQAQITIPGQSNVTVTGIPTGSTCTVTEVAPLPALPAGWFWQPPSYQPASGQVSLIGTCCPEIFIVDRAKFCCETKRDKADEPVVIIDEQQQ